MKEFVYNTADVYNTNAAIQPTNTYEQNNSYKLVDQNDPILTAKLNNFDFSNGSLNPVDISSKLISTCEFHKVYSIAANQCGLPYKIVVAGAEDNFVAFFNPVITEYSSEVSLLPESDLSNMGLVLHVKRPKSITVEYQDYTGENKSVYIEGLTARVVQQGIDRINGIDYKTKVSKLVLERATKSLNKQIKRFFRSQTIIK